MTTGAIIATVVLASFAAIHALCALVVYRWRGVRVAQPPQGFHPRVAVILAVRGADPSLLATVRGLLRQTYRRYEIHIVVDDRADPAWDRIAAILAAEDTDRRANLHELLDRPTTCGLKCAALVQAVRGLQNIEVLATIDADVVPHPEWLATLVAPLVDPQIGVVTGNHWFSPDRSNTGSLLRSLWNAGSLVPTTIFANPWAGTSAFRWEDVLRSGLLERWERSMVDDGPVRRAYSALGKKIEFVPGLVMLNRESCSVAYFVRYIVRMMTWSRLYEPSYWFTVLHALVNGSAWALVAGMGLWGMLSHQREVVGWAAAGLAAHAVGLWASYLIVRHGAARMAACRGERFSGLTLATALQSLVLTPIAFLLHGYGVMRAALTRTICWRGVWYQLNGPDRIVRRGDGPLTGLETGALPSEWSI